MAPVTLSKSALAARRQGSSTSAPTTALGAWRAALLEMLEAEHRISFPDARYQTNPLAFFREILGVEPWAKSLALIDAVRVYDRVAVKAGRKVAKSWSLAGLALWFYCAFPDARVVMTSTTSRQVDAVLWRELSMMRARSGRCVACKAADPNALRIPRPCPHSALIDGEIGLLARTGLKSDDFREVFGFTAKEGEAVQGISGTRLLYIVDEASGIPDAIYEAIEGNRGGGAKVILSGNPTKTSGEFFDAFHAKALDVEKKRAPDEDAPTGYFGLTISSEDSPNVVEGREVIRGLATREWIRERQREWGVESPLYRIHVKGEFATNEDGRVFSVEALDAARVRWEDSPPIARKEIEALLAKGHAPAPLVVGLDPAGATGTGDESCFAPRRGPSVEHPIVARGLDANGHLRRLLEILDERLVGRERATVVMDRTGSIGAELYGRLVSYLDEMERGGRAPRFRLVGVKFSDKAQRRPEVFDTMRDELYANLELSMREGAGLPDDAKLQAELHVLEWRTLVNGKTKITPKDEIKKALGRSPDRGDAVALCYWEEQAARDARAEAATQTPEQRRSKKRVVDVDDDDIDPGDPYDAEKSWRRG